MDDDIDGIPLEKVTSSSMKSGGFIPSKWETVDPDQVSNILYCFFFIKEHFFRKRFFFRLKHKLLQQVNGTHLIQLLQNPHLYQKLVMMVVSIMNKMISMRKNVLVYVKLN